jgi:HEPN domain-containing protein
MFAGGRWFYVIFMCQQAVEKLTKGLYTLYIDDNVPRVHNIKTLVERFEDKLSAPVPLAYYQFFDTLSAYYLNTRYPDFMSKISEQTDESKAQAILAQTKGAFAWLLTLKP